MKLYLVYEQPSNKLWLYFFLKSALSLVARLTDAAEWKLESNESPWEKLEQENGNTVWQRGNSGHTVELIPLGLLFRDWSVKRWIRKRLHWQNLNEKGREDVVGSILKHGRAWFKPFGYGRNLSFNLEWSLWSKRVSAGLGLADYDHAVSVHLCVYLFSLYFTLEYFPLEQWLQKITKRKAEKYGNGRDIGFHWMEGSLFINLWSDPMEWRSQDPKWGSFTICPSDILLGKRKYSERELRTDTRMLTLPERTYPVQIKLMEATWKRPRWPFPDKIVRASVEVEGGVPVPGKGENSWDCGEDAIYSSTMPAKTFDEALSGLYASVMRDRERYGGKNWLPSAVAS